MNITQTLAITWPEFMDALTYQITGMLVVLCCLGLLCIILSISGAIAVRLEEKKKAAAAGVPTGEEAAAIAMALDQEMNGEVYAAISLALHQYLNDTVHDNESYVITIKRKK